MTHNLLAIISLIAGHLLSQMLQQAIGEMLEGVRCVRGEVCKSVRCVRG